MPTALTNFLVQTSLNPLALERFRADPRSVLEEAGLSGQEADAVLNKDAVAIHKAITEDFTAAGDVVNVVVVVLP